MASVGYLYIDNTIVGGTGPMYQITNSTSYTVTSTGLTTSNPSLQWTYSGSETFAGFSLTDASTPHTSFEIGDSGSFNDSSWWTTNGLELYTVEGGGSGVTDLTGTTWEFNESISFESRLQSEINFVYNNQEYILLYGSPNAPNFGVFLGFQDSNGDGFTLYSSTLGGWQSQDRIISITGGSKVTSVGLIAWFEANATQVLPDPFTITYNNSKIYGTSQDGTVTLPCANKVMASDITVTGSDVYSVNINYNGSTITTASGTFTKTLPCAGKVMATDVTIAVVISSIIYTFENGELTISNAPYEFSGGELTI